MQFLIFLFVAWLLPCSFSAVASPRGDPRDQPKIPKSPATIIDYLSADTQYSYFLRHIQRLGLVPVINNMANVTVFAPINSAFVESELAANDTPANILRYFAAQKFRVSYLNGSSTVLDSLYEKKRFQGESRMFPLKISSDRRQNGALGPYMVNDAAEIVEFDGYAKHQHSFIQTIDHLLPSAVSMCDFLMEDTPQVNGHLVSFVKRVFQSVFAPGKQPHGLEHLSCDSLFKNVSTVLLPTDRFINASFSDMEKRYFLALHHGLENPALYPTKDAVREMKRDALAFLSTLLLPDLVGGINGTDSSERHLSVWGKNSYNISLDSRKNRVRLNNKVWSVAGSTSLTLSDGLLHLFDFDPEDDTQADDFISACNIERVNLVPRKTLYAMHFSQLVRELKFFKKSYLIGEAAKNQTIIVDVSDRDDFFDEEEMNQSEMTSSWNEEPKTIDAFDLHDDDDDDDDDDEELDNLPMKTLSFSNRQQMLYKFIDGFVDISSLLTHQKPRFHQLFDSKLCSKKRLGSCFKVKISGALENGKPKVFFNDIFEAGLPFFATGNNSIYVVQTDFTVPASFKNVMAQLISDGITRDHLDHVTVDKSSCLQSLKYLDKFGLSSLKDNYQGYTVFLPCGRTVWDGSQLQSNKNYASWDSLGLILKHLENNPSLFKKVLRGNFIEDLIYSDFGLEDNHESSRLVKTLNGDFMNISETYQEGDYNHLINLNKTPISIPLNSDVLFNQGVIHITQKVLLPGNFQISLRELIQAGHGSGSDSSSFMSFIEKFPKLSRTLNLDNPSGSGYSLLMPTSDSLKSFNITGDFTRLLEFLELHLIPNSEADILRRCMGIPFFEPRNSTYMVQTNRTHGTFKCHSNPSSGKTYLTVPKKFNMIDTLTSDGDRQARIINYGCSQQDAANSSCVFLLDRPLDVTWFDPPDNLLHVHIGWISVGIGIVIGVILFGFCTTTVALCLSRAANKKNQLSEIESNFTPVGSSYMPITSDEDLLPANYDRGYETDVDMLRSEADQLLPKKGNRRPPVVTYGSSSPVGAPSAPRKIKKQAVIENINRERNLPSLNI